MRMSEYRMYTLDGLGRIGLPEPLLADGDSDALAQVRELAANAKRCELWEGRRLVAALSDGDLAQ
jgi:hypothetical protein